MNNTPPPPLATGQGASTAQEPLELRAADGFALAATWRIPLQAPRGVVVIAPATGVPRQYYDRFAAHLAEVGGLAVLSFDYRGIGQSRPARLRGFAARMREWGTLDLNAALEAAGRRFPDVPLTSVAHSVGGQIFGLAAAAPRVRAVLAVAAQHGYWRNWPRGRQPRLWLLWHVLFPTITPALGYFPSRRFGLGENLPRGVALEWAQWCRSHDYLRSVVPAELCGGYDAYRGAWRSYALADDDFAPRRAVERLHDWYPRAERSTRYVEPAAVGQRSIGHFGFFRDRFRETLWREATDWLHAQCGAAG